MFYLILQIKTRGKEKGIKKIQETNNTFSKNIRMNDRQKIKYITHKTGEIELLELLMEQSFLWYQKQHFTSIVWKIWRTSTKILVTCQAHLLTEK